MRKQFIELQKASINHLEQKTDKSFERLRKESKKAQKCLDNCGNPPKPPLCRVLRTGVNKFCKNCHSTMSRSGFLMLFSKRYCDNKKCPNSKPEKNYY